MWGRPLWGYSLNPEDQVSVFIPQEQSGPVIPPSTGLPFCRLLRLAGLLWRYSKPPPYEELTENSSWLSLYSLGTDLIENTASNNSSVVAWLFVTAEKCSQCHCLAKDAWKSTEISEEHIASIFMVEKGRALLATCFQPTTRRYMPEDSALHIRHNSNYSVRYISSICAFV
jgi:hypothetical protein